MWGQYYTLTVYLGCVELLELTTCKLEGYKEQLGWDWTLTVSLFFLQTKTQVIPIGSSPVSAPFNMNGFALL